MRLFKKRIRNKPDNCPYCNQSRDSLFYKHVAYAHQHETATQACGTPMLRAQQLADEESAVEHATNDDIYDAAVELVRETEGQHRDITTTFSHRLCACRSTD